MGKIVVTVLEVLGHQRPFVPLIEALQKSEHEVHVIAESPVPQIEKLGVGVTVIPSPFDPGGAASGPSSKRDFETLLRWQRSARIETPLHMLPLIQEALAAQAPELVVTDAQNYEAIIATHQRGTPYVSVFTNLMSHLHDRDTPVTRLRAALEPELMSMFEAQGMRPRLCCWDIASPFLNIVFSTEALLGTERPEFFLAGPSIPPADDRATHFPWERLQPGRFVFAACGSTRSWPAEMFRVIDEACSELNTLLVLACGELIDSDLPASLNPRTVAVGFAPQAKLLEQAAVFVTHGGANSIMEACSSGTPMLVLPLVSDQHANGMLLSEKQIGAMILAEELTVERCRETLRALLAQRNGFRERMNVIRESYRAKNGGAEAARAICALMASR
jgi:UDP:flavonoid glycosyltransferase YjiC (YdhE family)